MGNINSVGALVHPAGRTKLTSDEKKARLHRLRDLNLELTELSPEVEEDFNLTAGKPLERALLLA